MEQIKKQIQKAPMRKAMRWTFIITFFCVCIFIGLVIFQTNQIQNSILERKEYTIDPIDGTWDHEPFTSREAAIYYGCYVAMVALPAMGIFGAMVLSASLFYRFKLQEPIGELEKSISKISEDDLDFSISYDSEGELGTLCSLMERMRRELQHSKEQTWELLQQTRMVNASVAHDLRTPITVVKGYLDYMKEGEEKRLSDKEIRTAVCGMSEAVDRLEQYVGCIQDMDRLGNLKVQRREERVSEALQELERDIGLLGTDKEIRISCRLPHEKITIDKGLVFRVIENLVQNAVRYATSQVIVELDEEEGFFVLCVKDDGPGFSSENLKRAADLFFTTDKGEHFGLGLSICKILCEKMEGTLTVKNQPAGGAAITATIKK